MTPRTVSRRTFLAISATLPFALRARAASSIPVGLELYSVRNELQRDPQATVRAVAKMGYQCVEFYALVAHFCDGAHGGLRVALKFFADGIKLEADGNGGRGAGAQREGQSCRYGK